MNEQRERYAIRVAVVHLVAKVLGVLVKIDGLPYGSSRNFLLSREANPCSSACGSQPSYPEA